MSSLEQLIRNSGVELDAPRRSIEAGIVRNERFFLCDDAEPYLDQAMENGLTLVIEKYLVMKFVGRKAMLCTKTFTASDGTRFKRGKWYSPASDSRGELEQLFYAGHQRVNIPSGMNFVKVRRVKSNNLVAKALTYAQSVPGSQLNSEETKKRNKKLNDYRYYA